MADRVGSYYTVVNRTGPIERGRRQGDLLPSDGKQSERVTKIVAMVGPIREGSAM